MHLRVSLHRGDALQFDGNRGRQPVDFHRGAAGLVVLEVLRVQAVERVKIAVHVHEEDGDVYELFPAAFTRFKDGFDVGEDAVDLCLKIKRFEVAVVVQLQAGHPAVVRVASCRPWPDAAQEQEVADAAGVGVEADGLGGVGGGNAFAHDTKVGCPPPSCSRNRMKYIGV